MNMRRYVGVLCIIGCMLCTQHRAAATPPDPEMDAARAANAAARAIINSTDAPPLVPGYTEHPPESALYGRTDLRPDAEARLAACRSRQDDPVCAGQVGAVTSAGTPREPVPATDPAVAGAAAIAANPFTVEGSLSSWYSGCSSDGVCAPSRFCIGHRCFDLTSPQDPNFAQVMSYMEAGREAGVYLDPATIKVFSGEGNFCRNRLLTNCCRTNAAGRGFANQSLFGIGSRVVYDILMNSGNRAFLKAGFKALLLGNGFSGTFTTYGITVAVNGVVLPAGSVPLYSSPGITIGFDPYTLAIAVIFYMVMSMMSCNDEEGKLAMKEGARLCHFIGTWCSSCIRVLGRCVTCIEHKTGKCCFNSRLARMINEQGRSLMGIGWGTARQPSCDGFSVAQLQALDFSRMDLTEFYAEIVPNLPDLARLQRRVGGGAVNCYAGGGRCQ